jgi:hypothetical protein
MHLFLASISIYNNIGEVLAMLPMSTGSKLLTVGAFYPYTVRNLARPAFHAIRSLPRPTSRPGFTSSSRLSVPETGASASSGTRGPGEKSGTKGLVRISHLFGALAGVGLLVTIYGLYVRLHRSRRLVL